MDYEKRALAACVEVGKLLTSTLDLKEILNVIVIKVSQLIDAENWSLLLQDEKTGELSFDIVVGLETSLFKGIRLMPGEGIAGYAVKTCQPVIIKDAEKDDRFYRKVDELTGFKTKSIICIPLITHGNTLGVLEIVNVKDVSFFETKYLSMLKVLSDYAAIAIQNANYYGRIKRISITDEYTGLYNARFLHQCLDDMVIKCSESEEPFSVVFVDVDNFKGVVDTHGHLLGSRVLKELGQTIAACIHENDYLIKYGGDEFVIIFPGKSKKGAVSSVEEILCEIRNTTYLEKEDHPVKVTASFGIAVYPHDAKSPKELLMKADQLMYEVKGSTKDGYDVS